MTPTVLLVAALIYVTVLFTVARLHERRNVEVTGGSPLIYALTLAVFCTSWTFYGAVGSMTAEPWSHAPIYLGPIILLVVFRPVVDRLTRIGHRQRVTSIADFLGARFGKRQVVAAVVALICLLAVLPYLALQYRALQQIWAVVNTGEVVAADTSADNVTLLVAVGLALFAILFGVRRMDGSERQRGLMQAMAVESVVKLVAFAAVALLAMGYIYDSGSTIKWSALSLGGAVDADFLAKLLISGLAILCLPRQFHVSVVEVESLEQTALSRWVFPLYLLAFMILAVPISIAGSALFQGDGSVSADTYVQVLPIALGADWVALIAFLGGISAATGMALVATVAVSIMVTNELVTPLLYRVGFARSRALLNLGTFLRRSRQITIVIVSLAAWIVASRLSSLPALSQIGFLSFLGAVQLAPPLLMGLYWRRTHGLAVLAGMLAGIVIWLTFGVLPIAMNVDESLAFSHLVALSLGVNTVVCVLMSFLFKRSPADVRQAGVFLGEGGPSRPLDLSLSPIPILQLDNLISPLLSDVGAQRFWRELETTYEQRLLPTDRAPLFVVAAAEAVLSNAVGASSARQIISRLESDRQLELSDITDLLGHAQQGSVFNRESLEAAVENLSHGVSVIDAELRLVAWNSRYEAMFDYPSRFLFVGSPIERVYRFNAERGILGRSDRPVEEEVQRRLQYMREGSAHQVERLMPDGRVLDIRGTPVPGGGFVTTYVDITEYREMTRHLEEARHELEQRLASGEQTLSDRNALLRQEVRRRSEAETRLRDSFKSKADFMAATSHDLLQPINAARLFATSLKHRYLASPATDGNSDSPSDSSWQQLDTALERSQQMITELREMASLDSGRQQVAIESVPLKPMIASLVTQFVEPARQKGIRLVGVDSSLWVNSDAVVLRRLLENLLANAVKYTQEGGVVLGVRRLQNAVRIQVCDTGPGLTDSEQGRIFNEFERLDRVSGSGADGLGLGLALVTRYAGLIGGSVSVSSVPGRGSIFSVDLPRGTVGGVSAAVESTPMTGVQAGLSGRVVLLDNDPSLLAGIAQLLEDFGLSVTPVSTSAAANAALFTEDTPDLLIADNHLDNGENGFETARQARSQGFSAPVLIVSADDSPDLRDDVRAAGFRFLPKPIEPQRLRALLDALL